MFPMKITNKLYNGTRMNIRPNRISRVQIYNTSIYIHSEADIKTKLVNNTNAFAVNNITALFNSPEYDSDIVRKFIKYPITICYLRPRYDFTHYRYSRHVYKS